MVATMMRVCSSPITPSARAAPSSGSTGSRSIPVGDSLGSTARAVFTLALASPAEIVNACRSNAPVEVQPCLSAMPRVSISPVRWTCAAYTNRLTRSKPWANTSRSGSGIFQNSVSRTASNAAHATPTAAVAGSGSVTSPIPKRYQRPPTAPLWQRISPASRASSLSGVGVWRQ